ncbi:branched-chain amino acid ABC transporter permease [Hydrogenibacillus schlegelii]|nr:branched-chain amino acid ABC transporter permease [Hydrogenibacillus schlegelii]
MVLLQLTVSGILLGGIYALIAVGLTLIFGVMRIVNFTHGDLVMLGMYLTYLLYKGFGLDPYISLFIVPLALFFIGVLIQKLVVQRVVGRPHEVQIFATVGLSMMLSNAVLAYFKGDYRSVQTTYSTDTIQIGPVFLGVPQIVAFGISAVITLVLFLFLKFTYTGKAIRATTQNRISATLMGIDVRRVYTMTFAIGSALAGIAAVLLMPLYPTYPSIGEAYLLIAFVVVVLGGLGSIPGALVGALIIGVVETVSAYYLGSGWKQAAYFVIFILVLIMRPQGLFGQRGAEQL